MVLLTGVGFVIQAVGWARKRVSGFVRFGAVIVCQVSTRVAVMSARSGGVGAALGVFVSIDVRVRVWQSGRAGGGRFLWVGLGRGDRVRRGRS